MNQKVDLERLQSALQIARSELLSRRVSDHWVGRLASSALSTATAVSALSLVRGRPQSAPADATVEELITRGSQWIARQQQPDGGWGDTEQSRSNIATTLLCAAALKLEDPALSRHAAQVRRADTYIDRHDGIEGLRRRYGKDKTFAVPILMNVALAGRVDWSQIPSLPFELACLPQSFYRFVRLPVVSYAIPALVAVGQAVHFHKTSWLSRVNVLRSAAKRSSLSVLDQIQPPSGGFLEAIPLTSFVVMALASVGQGSHPVARRGIDFLTSTVRSDGSWPIDADLATWNTSLAISALRGDHCDDSLEWLLSCQHRRRHPYTGADPGGWAWSNLSGAVPDADDTPAALLALSHLHDGANDRDQQRIEEAAKLGVRWLLGLQNRDGGWPTFCRGWGTLPFDRSGTDLTAHAMRALVKWGRGDNRVHRAVERGWRFLARQQQDDGSWIPLWFGNEHHPEELNPVYGTSKVLLAYRDLDRRDDPSAKRAYEWLRSVQNGDGGWGKASRDDLDSSVEETALALEALLSEPTKSLSSMVCSGIEWLIRAVECGTYLSPSPIGLYFAKLWYHEELYPLTFAVSTLHAATKRVSGRGGTTKETAPPPASVK